eukprot:scaffold46646_cov63-Phaeocystis_antarctica.AAC.3
MVANPSCAAPTRRLTRPVWRAKARAMVSCSLSERATAQGCATAGRETLSSEAMALTSGSPSALRTHLT